MAADVNGDGMLNSNDALLMFYTEALGGALDSSAGLRSALLSSLRGSRADTNAGHLELLASARVWLNDDNEMADINGDGAVGVPDTLILFYANALGNALRSAEGLRSALLGNLRGSSSNGGTLVANNDEGYMKLLTSAQTLITTVNAVTP
jgi:hypothetical protein